MFVKSWFRILLICWKSSGRTLEEGLWAYGILLHQSGQLFSGLFAAIYRILSKYAFRFWPILVMLNYYLGQKTDWKNSFSMSTCSLRFVLLMLQLIMIFDRLGDLFRHFKCLKSASVYRVLGSFSWYSFRPCYEEAVTRFSSF